MLKTCVRDMPMSALHAWCDFFGIPRKTEKKSAP
jgi:hypothetical protein